jgi:hypothetical protein
MESRPLNGRHHEKDSRRRYSPHRGMGLKYRVLIRCRENRAHTHNKDQKEQGVGKITIKRKVVIPADTAKFLGVIFDKRCDGKSMYSKQLNEQPRSTFHLGLRHLHPEQMRQLYQACAIPIVDYASFVWHNPLGDKIHLRTVGTMQRTALTRILSAFKLYQPQHRRWNLIYYPPTYDLSRVPEIGKMIFRGFKAWFEIRGHI